MDNNKEQSIILNLKALIATTRKLKKQEVRHTYHRYKAKHPFTETSFGQNRIMRFWIANAAILILLVGIGISMNNILKIKRTKLHETTILTENGQKTKVTLPDGSKVWLNYGSKISYNNDFGKKSRNVILTGEAYFSVTKNKNIAFRVYTNYINVKVLGTEFNIKAYNDNAFTRVSLNEGSLEVMDSKTNRQTYILVPGEEAKYSHTDQQFEISRVNAEKISAWKEGYLYFEKTPIDEVLKELERKYNVEFIADNQNFFNNRVTATIKNENLTDVLKAIGYSCELKFAMPKDKQINRKIIIKKLN